MSSFVCVESSLNEFILNRASSRLRAALFVCSPNDASIGDDLDLAEEGCENAQIKLAAYQQEVVKGYNRSVRFQAFKPDNLVWKKVVKKSKKKVLLFSLYLFLAFVISFL